MAERHRCKLDTAWSAYDRAVVIIVEDAEGHFWATTNGEYANHVEYCPACGVKAITPAVHGEVEYARGAVSKKEPGTVKDVRLLLGIEDWYNV